MLSHSGITAIGSIWIETERLLLRPPVLDDFDAWAALAADAETMRHLGGIQARPVAWRHFAFTVGSWHLQGFSGFSVIERASGCWIGRVGPLKPEGWPGTEVGWTLARPYWGKGYAVEAARAAIDWVCANLRWHEIIHCIGPANVSSIAVAKKLGSSALRTAQMPAPYENMTVDIWGQSREQWLARRAREKAT